MASAAPEQVQEWLPQLSLIYGGLIVIGVYMAQPFLTAASLDLSAKSVVAFSVAIPLLAALVMLNRQEASSSDQVSPCRDYEGGRANERLHWSGRRFWRLERDQESTPQEGKEPGDTES